MSKIGVGIGEDFPVDDPREDAPRDERAGRPGDDAGYEARREAHRKWHEARREWKRQWRDEWRTRRSEFRSRFKDSYYDGHARPYMGFGHPFAFGPHMLWRAVAVVAAIAAIVFLFSHIYIVLGALVVAALVAAAWHRGFDPFDLPSHRYDRHDRRDDREPPRPQPPASEPPRDSAH
ncbi:MAG TPA: hypothetical protein VHZ78_09425 [Rhizomicrobium sp.]|jgi:hypothetical protein|nr:hypothetical protein [Rhizomicrobium sp.]